MNFPTDFTIPDNRPRPLRDYSLADRFIESVEKHIKELQERLAGDEQLLVMALLPGSKEILVNWIGYSNPNLVVFDGTEMTSGHQVSLLAHQDTVQLLCRVEKIEPQRSRRTIGFTHNDISSPWPLQRNSGDRAAGQREKS